MRRLLAILGAALAVVLVSVLLPPAAQGMPFETYEQGRYDEKFSFSYDDCGFPVEVEGRARGHFRTTVVPNSGGQAFLADDHYRYHEIHTNTETGAWLRIRGTGHFKERTARHVEGDIWEFTATDTGTPFVVIDSDGRKVLRDHGKLWIRALFDTLGDSQPGGIVIEDEITRVRGKFPSLEVDFCQLVGGLIG
ncbi:hypothetical protein ACFP3Q_17260 [Nocardioides sp. GCM10027113]|uniref:hypothetical protein n=1 Tax=unclassified Nocardioides TaxID=2615069 RepID=UPI00360A3130